MTARDPVICDLCGIDYTTRPDTGGLLILSNAVCPACAPGVEADAAGFGETWAIRARALGQQSFADFVHNVRACPPLPSVRPR